MKQPFLVLLALVVAVPLLGDREMDGFRLTALSLLSSGETGVVEFNHWRVDQPGAILNLTRANLKNKDLRQANLSLVDLSEADLSGAQLWRTYFYRANLRGANLTNVRFEGADFRGATYAYATMSAQLLSQIERQNRETVIIVK